MIIPVIEIKQNPHLQHSLLSRRLFESIQAANKLAALDEAFGYLNLVNISINKYSTFASISDTTETTDRPTQRKLHDLDLKLASCQSQVQTLLASNTATFYQNMATASTINIDEAKSDQRKTANAHI